jgi:hypothetical protein
MKHLKLFENYDKNSFSQDEISKIELGMPIRYNTLH